MTGHRSFDEEAKNNRYDPSNHPKAVLLVLVTFALTYFTVATRVTCVQFQVAVRPLNITCDIIRAPIGIVEFRFR